MGEARTGGQWDRDKGIGPRTEYRGQRTDYRGQKRGDRGRMAESPPVNGPTLEGVKVGGLDHHLKGGGS